MGKKKISDRLARLRDLNRWVSAGDTTLKDFDLLGIQTVEELAHSDAKELFDKLCLLKGEKLDPCCEEVLRIAVAEARAPKGGARVRASLRSLGPLRSAHALVSLQNQSQKTSKTRH